MQEGTCDWRRPGAPRHQPVGPEDATLDHPRGGVQRQKAGADKGGHDKRRNGCRGNEVEHRDCLSRPAARLGGCDSGAGAVGLAPKGSGIVRRRLSAHVSNSHRRMWISQIQPGHSRDAPPAMQLPQQEGSVAYAAWARSQAMMSAVTAPRLVSFRISWRAAGYSVTVTSAMPASR